MKIIIQCIHFKASPELKKLVREKVSKLFHLSNRIISAEVTLSIGAKHAVQIQVCEIRLVLPGNDLFVKKESELFERSLKNAAQWQLIKI